MEKEREIKLYVEKLKERIAKGIFAEISEMRENYLTDDALTRGLRLSKLRARYRALLMVKRKGKWIAKILRSRKWITEH